MVKESKDSALEKIKELRATTTWLRECALIIDESLIEISEKWEPLLTSPPAPNKLLENQAYTGLFEGDPKPLAEFLKRGHTIPRDMRNLLAGMLTDDETANGLTLKIIKDKTNPRAASSFGKKMRRITVDCAQTYYIALYFGLKEKGQYDAAIFETGKHLNLSRSSVESHISEYKKHLDSGDAPNGWLPLMLDIQSGCYLSVEELSKKYEWVRKRRRYEEQLGHSNGRSNDADVP